VGIDLAGFKDLFFYLYQTFNDHAPRLNALDSAVGDGDHGDTMLRGFRAAAQTVRDGTYGGISELFDAVADTLAEETGGAIGPLLAAFFAEGGLAFSGMEVVGVPALALFFKHGLDAVGEVGGAQPGDKTLVDALAPAVRVLVEGQGLDMVAALDAAAQAAEHGAQATQDYSATLGRARFLGERSVGHPDPGAVSFALIVRALHAIALGDHPTELETETFAASQRVKPLSKFINDPEDMVTEDNRGLALAYPQQVRLTESGVLVRAQPKGQGKVGLAIGHGGGHTPSMGGFLGAGLLDADVYGPLFTCASGLKIARAIELAERGGGVALLVSNHAGDVLNARLAARRVEQLGIPVCLVFSSDDVATAPREEFEARRGLGGILFPLKVGGGAAEAGLPLSDVAELMRNANERTATLAVASRAPRHPVSGERLFDLPEGQIEVGTGVHGEVGVYRGELMKADDLVAMMLDRLVPDLAAFIQDQVWVFLNGSGGTSQMELHILYQAVHQALAARGLQVAAGVVGSYFTTLEMGGFSLSLCALDEEGAGWWKAPASSPAFRWPLA
jgi:phosphoenolpyruvate---glycerone phosphotransferase subunit DhaK